MDIKKIVLEMLKEQFGADLSETDIEFKLMGKNRIYAYKPCEIGIQEKHSGIYFGTIEKDGIRLSIEGSYIVGKVAKKCVLEIEKGKVIDWMKGYNIDGKIKGYVILKWKNYFLGCGRGNGKIIRNYIPKNRRIDDDLKKEKA